MPKKVLVKFSFIFASGCLWVDQPYEPLYLEEDESRTILVRAG